MSSLTEKMKQQCTEWNSAKWTLPCHTDHALLSHLASLKTKQAAAWRVKR